MKKCSLKNLPKQILSVFLSLVICLTVVLVPTMKADAGIIGMAIGRKWAKIAISMIDRSIIFGISSAAKNTEDEELAKALNVTTRLLAGAQVSVNSQLISMCKNISADISALYNVVTVRTSEIEEFLQQMDQDTKMQELIDAQEDLLDFYVVYEGMIVKYQEFFDSVADYDSTDEASVKRLNNAYRALYQYYEANPSSGDSTLTKFSDDLTNFLAVISPYNPNQKIDQNKELDDPESWEKLPSMVSKTYTDYVFKYLTSVTSFENNIYDGMCSAINQVSAIGYEFIQAYRFYAELETMLINSNPALSESEIRTNSEYVWDTFNNDYLRLQRGLNQMCSLYGDELNTYMRSYDTLVQMQLSDYKRSQSLQDAYSSYPDVQNNLKNSDCGSHTDWARDDGGLRYAYQFKIYNDPNNKTFAIMNSNSYQDKAENASQYYYDKTNAPFKAKDMIIYHAGSTNNSGFSLNYINLTRPTSTPEGFNMLSSASELSPIVSTSNKAYSKNNSTLIDYLNQELGLSLGAENVYLPNVTFQSNSNNDDNLKKGQFLLLNTQIKWDADNTTFGNTDADVTWMNISMPLAPENITSVSDGNSHEITIDCENDIADVTSVGNGEIVSMYVSAQPKVTIKAREYSENGGSGDTRVTIDGEDDLPLNTTRTVNSGKLVTIEVAPKDGSTLDSIVVKGQNGQVLTYLLQDNVTTTVEIRDKNGSLVRVENDGYKLTDDEASQGYTATPITSVVKVQEILDDSFKNSRGYYQFTVPVPYQDSTISIVYGKEDSSLLTYDVTLNDTKNTNGSYDAVLQFTGYDYLAQKSFKEGDEVSLVVSTYNNMICTGITLKNESGSVIDEISVSDITDDSLHVRPNEKVFSFTMPAKPLIVEAKLKSGNTVSSRKNIPQRMNTIYVSAHIYLGKMFHPFPLYYQSFTFSPFDELAVKLIMSSIEQDKASQIFSNVSRETVSFLPNFAIAFVLI